jgi:hypothetical protein
MPNGQDPIVNPGQVTSIPASNYDINKDLGRVIDRTNIVDAPSAPNLLFGSGVPVTGDGRSKVNPLYGQYMNILKNNPVNPLTQQYLTPLNKTERYSTNEYGGYNPYDVNLENWYGENQGWLSQWGNRLGKLGVKAIGSFAGALMDIPNAISAVSELNVDKLWDNPTNTWASDMIEWSEKNLPNYQTNWETEHPFLNLIPFYGNSGNGWGKVVENLGFTVGAIGGAIVEDLAVGALTGGVGEVPLAAMQINKAVYRLGKLINAGEDSLGALKQSIKSADDIIKGLKGIDRFNYTVRKGLWGANMLTSGMSEAAFEGIESYKTLSKDLKQEFFENNGRIPTVEESQKIDSTARDAANTRFLMNTALLAVTNTIQWGSLMRPFNVTKELIEEEAKAGVRIGLKEGSKDVFQAIEPTSRLAKFSRALANNKVVTTIVGSGSEGFEEGAQFAIQTGVDDYYKRKYNDESIDSTNNFLKSFGTAMSKTLGSQEGWENIVYGLLGGAMYKAGEGAYYKAKGAQSPDYRKKVQSVIDGLNSQSLTGIFENKYGETIAADAIEKDLSAAVKNDNVFLYRNYKHEQFTNFILSGIQQNKYETRIEQLQELKKLDDGEFNKTFGIPATDENRRSISTYVDNMERNANYIKQISDRVNRTFINPFAYKGTGNYKNKEQAAIQNEDNEKYLVYEEAKRQLIYATSVAKDSSDRIASIRADISQLSSFVPADDVIKLSSQEGLKQIKKDYKEKIKILEDNIKISPNNNAQKELDYYKKLITDIDEITDQSDLGKQTTKYNEFLESVFDKYEEAYQTIANNGVKPTTPAKFSKLVMNDMMQYGRDIYYLQKRSEVAVDNYSSLTTKGGFKKLFDNITQLRKEAAAREVILNPETPQPQNAQQQATFNNSQAQQGQTPTTQPQEQQGGIVDESSTALTDEQRKEIAKYTIAIVDGKYDAKADEYEFLEFKTIDDLKADNPKVDLTQYTKVKDKKSGKNYYILTSIIDDARKLLGEVVPANVAPPQPPTNTPPSQSKGNSPLRTEDYIGKVFVPNDLKIQFNDAIFSGTKNQVKDGVSVSVKPLSAEYQAQYDDQKAKGTYTEITGFPGVYVSKSPIDLSVEHNGVEIGKLAFPERLLFKVNNQYLTIDKITPKQYAQLTGKTPAQHASDVTDYLAQVDFKNYLSLKYKNNNYQPTTLHREDLIGSLFDLLITYGELDLVTNAIDRPLYNQLKHNTVRILSKDGKSSIDTMLIVSTPKKYVADTASRERTEFNNLIFGQNYYEVQDLDDSKIVSFLNNSADRIAAVNSRYIGVIEKPDGTWTLAALRPREMNSAEKEDLFDVLTQRAEESAKANFVVSTEEDKDGTLLIGEEVVHYKLPSDQAKKFNDDFNTDLTNQIFITDSQGKSWLDISVSPIGAIRLNITANNLFTKNQQGKNVPYETTLYIAPQKVSGIKDFAHLIELFNKEIEKKVPTDPQLASLNVNLTSSNFRKNIADDKEIPNAEELAGIVTTAVTPEVFKNGTMRIRPNSKNVQDAYKKAGGTFKADVTPEKQKQPEANPPVENLDNLFGKQQTYKDAVKPGIFGGFTQLPGNEQGEIELPADMFDVTPKNTKNTLNQESMADIEFPTIKDALAANDIGYKIDGGIAQFFSISTGEVIDLPGVSPAELATQMSLKIAPQQKKDPNEGFEFKLGENGTVEIDRMIDIEAAKSYIYSVLPSFIKVEDINTILDNISVKGDAWGAFSDGTIYLNSNAEKGTEYHEAFHGVFRTVLTDPQIDDYLKQAQSELYNKLKKEGKSIRDLLRERKDLGLYTNLTPLQAYDRLYEEYMADRYKDWKQNKEKAGFFDKLFDLINRLFKWLLRDKMSLDSLFYNIDKGVYRYSNIASNRFTQESTDEYTEPEFVFSLIPSRPGKMQIGKGQVTIKRNLDAKTSKQTVQNVAAYFNLYRNQDKYRGIEDEKILNAILDDLKTLYNIDNPRYAGYTQEEANKLLSSDSSFIYANEESREIIKEGAKKYINSIRYIEQFQEEDKEDSEQDAGTPSTGYDNSSENVGGFSSLPGLLRQYLGFTSYAKMDEFDNEELVDGVPILATIDSVSAYYGILRSLANITNPVKFFQKMIRFTDNNEQSRHFVEKFIKDTGLNVDKLMEDGVLEATINPALVELVRKGFNKFRIDYVFTEHDIKKRTTKSYHANRKNVENVQFDKWSNSYIADYSEYSDDAQREIRQQVNDIRNKYFDERRIIKYEPQKLDETVTEIRNALRNVGVQLSRDFIKYSILSVGARKFDVLNESYIKQGANLQFDDPANKFINKQDYQYVQIMKIGDEISLNNEFFEELSKSLAAGNNPYFRDIKVTTVQDGREADIEVEEEIDTAMVTRFLNIARGNSLFDETVGESSYTNAEDKVVYAHQDGTFNVKFSYQLRDTNFRKRLLETGTREDVSAYRDAYDIEWLTNNFLLNSDAFENIADNLLFQNVDGLRAVETNSLGRVITQEFRDQKEGVTYGSYSPREFIVNLSNLYVSYSKNQKTSKGSVTTTPHLIRVLEASKTGNTINLPINLDIFRNGGVTENTTAIIFDNVKKEFNRINRVQGEVGILTENIVENYHTGSFADDGFTVVKDYRGLKFTDNITSLISKSTAEMLEKKARTNQLITKEDEVQVKSEIAANLNQMVDDTLVVMQNEGIINKDAKGNYSNILLHVDFFKGNPSLNLQPVDNPTKFKNNIGQLIINDYINTTSYNQILHGDSALSLKNDGGVDAVKRAKGDNAAIISMRTDLTAPELGITESFTHSKIAIFKEPVVNDIKVADAQMYTTVNGLRYTLWGLGRLTPRVARLLDALQNGDNIHALKNDSGKIYDAIFDSDDGTVRWDEQTNSLKLVYKDGHSYFKMSVVVLQPDLTSYKDKDGDWKAFPGWETLHTLRTKMEVDGIHFAAPESASKMLTIDVAKGKDFSDLKGHLFDNTYFGLQTANPSNKKEITTPTQLIQLIDNEQDDDINVYFEGKTVSVGEVKKAYQNYIAQKTSNSYDAVRNEVYEIKEFDEDVEKSIQEGKVTPRLARFQQRAIDNLESTGADAQLLEFFSLDDNGAPRYNLNMSVTKNKFQQLYLAYFSKGVLSQKSPGYTVALFSGIDTKTIRKAKRIVDGKVVEWEHIRRDTWKSNHSNIQSEKIFSHPDMVTSVGQYYLDELRYNVPEYDNDGNITGYFSEMMMPAHYKEFLEIPNNEELPNAISKGFGVRIPSEDKASFMSLRNIDFLPANLGSTGMFAKEIIALSGADFDIDKEYISRYDFYTTRDDKGNVEFHKYGDVSSLEGKWEEYKMWMGNNNKTIRGLIKDISNNDADYQQFITKDIGITDILGNNITSNLKKKYFSKFISEALKQLGFPSTIEEFESVSKNKELNNGALTNKIVDSYISLLTNDGMRDIASTPASLTSLEKIQFSDDITLRDANGNVLGSIFEKKIKYPVDSLIGKYYAFKNNTTGKNNIGIDVNANLIYSIVNKGAINLREEFGFEFDEQNFNSFTGHREYNPDTKQFDGERTNKILSTLISSATDEAKEQLNALYNLSVDALKVVDYMVALKVPLKTAIYFVNQPSIRNYLNLKAVKQNTLQTTQEEKLFRDAFKEEAMIKTNTLIRDYHQLSDDEIFGMFEREGLIEVKC